MKSEITHKFPGTPTILGLAMLALFASASTSAADTGWYGGASAGSTEEDVNFDKVFQASLPPGFAITSYSDGDSDSGFKLFSGYQFNKFIAVEGGYFDLGDFNYRSITSPDGFQYGNMDADGWNIDLVGTLPLTQRLSALGRFGVNYADTGSNIYSIGATPTTRSTFHEENSNYKYGVGLQYAITAAFDMRLEAERYRIDEASGSKGDGDMFSLGVVYRFGRAEPVAATPASVPAPAVATVPQRALVQAPVPSPPAPVRVSFSADSLFDFNSSAIKPAGRAELNALAADLRGVEFETILVTGHTDRIGAQAYNLQLSNERATAVKDYLVSSANISAAQVTTRGVNNSVSVTTMAQCGNSLSRAQLIVCLAPDRRVEVEVSGTRPR